MKGSFFWRVRRYWTFFLSGFGKKEKEHFLFELSPHRVDAFKIFSSLADAMFQPNPDGYVYRGQIYQCRKLLDGGEHQFHLRFYNNGDVTGHFEVSPEWDISDHLSGVDLRTMTEAEAEQIRHILSFML